MIDFLCQEDIYLGHNLGDVNAHVLHNCTVISARTVALKQHTSVG